MNSQHFIEYEVIDATNKAFITGSLEEAIEYFRCGWAVYKHHRMVVVVSKFISSSQTVTTDWNGNPVFERKHQEIKSTIKQSKGLEAAHERAVRRTDEQCRSMLAAIRLTPKEKKALEEQAERDDLPFPEFTRRQLKGTPSINSRLEQLESAVRRIEEKLQ